MTLAERIKIVMGDMLPGEFARKIKVTPAAVTLWLNGETKSLKATTAAKMQEATKYSALWIVTGQGPRRVDVPSAPPAPATPADPFGVPTPEEMAFLNDYRQLLDSDRDRYRQEVATKAQQMRKHMNKLLGDLKLKEKP